MPVLLPVTLITAPLWTEVVNLLFGQLSRSELHLDCMNGAHRKGKHIAGIVRKFLGMNLAVEQSGPPPQRSYSFMFTFIRSLSACRLRWTHSHRTKVANKPHIGLRVAKKRKSGKAKRSKKATLAAESDLRVFTIDELMKAAGATPEKSRTDAADLVFDEVKAGLSFVRIADSRRRLNLPSLEHTELAKRALEVADKYMWNLKMDHPMFDQMMAQIELLKFELANFIESGQGQA